MIDFLSVVRLMLLCDDVYPPNANVPNKINVFGQAIHKGNEPRASSSFLISAHRADEIVGVEDERNYHRAGVGRSCQGWKNRITNGSSSRISACRCPSCFFQIDS
jgi:hypothetical protein